MWKPGKWVYVDDDDRDETSEQTSKSAPADDSHRAHYTFDPPSPPWKLGQVPIETAVFKDGRRMSKRFEKLFKEKEEKEKAIKLQTPTLTRKERSKSVITTSTNIGKIADHPTRRSRKSSAATHQAHNTNLLPRTEPSPPSLSGLALDSQTESHPTPKPRALKLSPPLFSDNLSNNKNSPSTSHLNPTSPSSTLQDASVPINHSSHPEPSSPPHLSTTGSEEPVRAPSPITHDPVQLIGSVQNNPTSQPNPANTTQLDRSATPNPCPPQIAQVAGPVKRFRPWEALKGIQTDGAEVAGDLKLIHEANLRAQCLPPPHHRSHRKRNPAGGPCVVPTDSNQLNPPNPVTDKSLLEATHLAPSAASPSHKRHSGHSSDLTELSSSLSDLSDDDSLQSSTSSIVYSESDVDDECLPQSLVRTVRRPSTTNTSQSSSLRWKRKKYRSRRTLRLLEEVDDVSDHQLTPKPYIKIKANVYPYRRPEVSELPLATCGCTDGGCGATCLNRATSYLCDPKRCLLGQACTNIPLHLRKDIIDESTSKLGKGLKVFYTGPQRGWGLKTEIKLQEGMFLIDYRGEIISREACYKRVVNEYRDTNSFYFLDYDGSEVIDAGKKGNCSRFINHSCEPNLVVERFKLPGLEEYQFGLFTLRDIDIDEELCYNYGWQNFSDIAPTSNIRTAVPLTGGRSNRIAGEDKPVNTATAPTVQRCFCGAKSCNGFLGIRKSTVSLSNKRRQTTGLLPDKLGGQGNDENNAGRSLEKRRRLD